MSDALFSSGRIIAFFAFDDKVSSIGIVPVASVVSTVLSGWCTSGPVSGVMSKKLFCPLV